MLPAFMIAAICSMSREYATKLQGMAQRIEMPEIGDVRTKLAEVVGQIKDGLEKVVKRAKGLWKSKLRSEDDLDSCRAEAEALVSAFENCPNDLQDLHKMQRALRTYHEDYKQLRDDRLTWPQFENLVQKLREETQMVIVENEVPWPPDKVMGAFAESITQRRNEASRRWIEGIEADAAAASTMSAAEANQLHNRASNPPPVLTGQHEECRAKVLKIIESRLDLLKIEWLVEKFKELALPLREKFLQLVAEDENR